MTGLDYAILAVYFLVVIAIGIRTRRSVHTSDDFFLSGRSLPSWITGLAFMAANFGSFELMGFAANGAKYGMFTNQLYWIGSVPAMIFSGLVMVRFFYNAKVRSVPEFLRIRFDEKCRGLNAISFAFLTIFTSGLSLYGLAIVFHTLFGWSLDLCIWLSGGTVLFYVMSGGLRASIYTEVLQFFLMVLGILPLSVMALRSVGGLSESALPASGHYDPHLVTRAPSGGNALRRGPGLHLHRPDGGQLRLLVHRLPGDPARSGSQGSRCRPKDPADRHVFRRCSSPF